MTLKHVLERTRMETNEGNPRIHSNELHTKFQRLYEDSLSLGLKLNFGTGTTFHRLPSSLSS